MPFLEFILPDQFAHGLGAFRNQIVRPAAQVRHSDLAYIDAKIVVKRREDLAKRHRSFVGFASESIGGADDLAGFHSTAGQQRAADARPVVASAVLVDDGSASKLTPNH